LQIQGAFENINVDEPKTFDDIHRRETPKLAFIIYRQVIRPPDV